MREYKFIIADGNAAASRGWDNDNYSQYNIEANSKKEAYDILVPAIYGYDDLEEWLRDDYMVDEDEDEILDFMARFDGERYLDNLDISGGDPYVVAEAVDNDITFMLDGVEEDLEEADDEAIDKEFWDIGVDEED